MAATVNQLDLPTYDPSALDRTQRLELLAELRAEHWLVRTPLGFALTRYDDIVSILRERRFHSALSLIPKMQGIETDQFEGRRQSILSMEGVEHTRLRRLVARAFTPAASERLRPYMRSVIGGLIDEALPAGGADFVTAISEPYPIPIICELLGAPTEDAHRFSEWATDIFRIFNQNLAEDADAIQRATAELDSYVRGLVDRRRSDPGDDLLSVLIAVEEEGDRLSTDELVMLAEAVLMAGTDTTRNQLACCIALLTAHPGQWQRLVDDPTLAAGTVDETMRYLGAVQGTMRVASEDVEYQDVVFPAGTLVSLSLAGANRDPSAFDDPVSFDVTRRGVAPHMTFGSGLHYCLGANLARAELQEALVLIAARMPGLTAAGPVEWKPETFGIWGPSHLPVTW